MALASLPVAKVIGNNFGASEDYLGYGSLTIIFSLILIIFTIGFLLGLASLYRLEKHKTLSLIAIFLNGSALLWFLFHLPI